MVANLQPRLTRARDTRYNLRGYAPVVPLLQTTAQQRLKNADARGISKNWHINRANRSSRGLQRPLSQNTCFLLSGIQALLHQPRFLNWIRSHNTTQPNGTVTFPCRALNEVTTNLEAQYLVGAGRLKLTTCPACLVKDFIQNYWGNVDIAPDNTPLGWSHSHAQMVAIRQLDRQLHILTPGAAAGLQQDPVEFQDRILAACLASTDHSIPANSHWITRHNALFHLDYQLTWQCACGAHAPLPFGTNSPALGFTNVGILDAGVPDSVAAAISRIFVPEVLDATYHCATCGLHAQRTEHKRIDGAPDILRIKIANLYYPSGQRNDNAIHLDARLDLTAYQAVLGRPAPLRYRLSSVLCHGGDGGTQAGHWTATVGGVEGVGYVDDGVVEGVNRGALGENPRGGRQGVVVMYTRVVTRE